MGREVVVAITEGSSILARGTNFYYELDGLRKSASW